MLCSVLMTTYNAVEWIQSAIDSVLAQECTDFELIVVDDGSIDGTLDVLSRIEDARVRVIKSKHVGRAVALNIALTEAQGQFLAINDADDVSEPHRLARQVEFLQAHNDVAAVSSWSHIIDHTDEIIGAHRPYQSWPQLKRRLAIGNPFLHSSIIYRGSILRNVGGFSQKLVSAIDYDAIVRCAKQGRLAVIPDFLVRIRIHSGQHFAKGTDPTIRWRNATQIALKASLRLYPYLTPVSTCLWLAPRVLPRHWLKGHLGLFGKRLHTRLLHRSTLFPK